MAQVAVNGTSIAYSDEGEGGPPFVFIHGWACDRTFWRPQVEDLKGTHRCISVDLRGRGESPAVGPYDVFTAAEDLAGVMIALGLQPAIIAGHSLGGIVALMLNLKYPELVLGIITGDSPLDADFGARVAPMVENLREAGTMDPVVTIVESFFVEGTPREVAADVRAVMLTCPVDVAAAMLDEGERLGREMPEAIRAADKKPFMAIWADNPLGQLDQLRELAPFVRQEPIAGAGHFFQLEQPAITNALFRAFLDDVARDPRLAVNAGE